MRRTSFFFWSKTNFFVRRLIFLCATLKIWVEHNFFDQKINFFVQRFIFLCATQKICGDYNFFGLVIHFFDVWITFFASKTFFWLKDVSFRLEKHFFVTRDNFFALAHKILCREIDFYIFEAIFWFLFIQKLKTAFQISTCVIKSQSRSLNSMDSKISDRSPLKIRAFLTFG